MSKITEEHHTDQGFDFMNTIPYWHLSLSYGYDKEYKYRNELCVHILCFMVCLRW